MRAKYLRVAMVTLILAFLAVATWNAVRSPLRELLSPTAPTCADEAQNQNESDVDCGGPCDRCVTGRRCTSTDDCGYRATCAAEVCRPLEWQQGTCKPLWEGKADAAAENLNIVLAGVGYQSQEEFIRDARKAIAADNGEPYPGLLFYEPMKSFRDRINTWYIEPIAPMENKTNHAGDCRTQCRTTLDEEHCPLLNRQVIYLCNAECTMVTESGGDLYIGKSAYLPFEAVHGFGHAYGFLEDTKDDSLMGNYLRIAGRQPKAEDFSAEARDRIAERLGRYRGKAYEPWYMLWITFDEQFNIITAREDSRSIGETRSLPAPYILRMNAGSLSYVFDFDAARTVISESFEPHAQRSAREPLKYLEVPLPLKISRLSADKLKLEGYKGDVEPYVLDIMEPSGKLVKRIPAETLAKALAAERDDTTE